LPCDGATAPATGRSAIGALRTDPACRIARCASRCPPSPRSAPRSSRPRRPRARRCPFELVRAGRRDAPLYCYRPLVGRFLAGRIGVLGRLASYPHAAHALAACGGLDDYLLARGERPHGTPRQRVDAALLAFVARVFEDSTDFELLRGRLEAAFQELESILLDGRAETAVIVPVLGITIESPELVLADGLALARGDAFDGEAPPEALWADGGEPHVLAVLRWELAPGDPAPLAHARTRLSACGPRCGSSTPPA
jgi:hypothetical protein